ncbi:hypothetical protein DPMN_141954 [Dreissena polymorpha]|uniref:Uncharacterized protein n=1 Tax=Dreissena polymorpha TaxID=45954 RepID=A0A9D4GDN8_DREPO|nr:hypothetical protein DPMN_141954 [Dreissena polymorpha]
MVIEAFVKQTTHGTSWSTKEDNDFAPCVWYADPTMLLILSALVATVSSSARQLDTDSLRPLVASMVSARRESMVHETAVQIRTR